MNIKTRRLQIAVFVLLMILAFLVGCTQTKGKISGGQGNLGDDKQGSMAKPQLLLTDMGGRQVVIEGEVNRIVAIGSALRLYSYVNGIDKLVGVERGQQAVESGRPYIMANPGLAELPLIGEGHPADPDPELLLGVDADVIIMGDIMDQGRIEQLQEKIGVPIVITTVGTSAVFDQDMYQSLRIIGQITDREKRATDIIEYMEACKQELYERTKDVADGNKPSVYVGGLSHKGIHGIESTASNSPLLSAINAKNVVDEIDKVGSVMIDKEQLIEWDPDIIIIDENGLQIVRDDFKKNTEFYATLSAFKDGKVYGQLPYVAYYNNIETALADVYFAGKILFSEQFQDVEPEIKADEIYNFFLGKPLYQEMTQRYGGYTQLFFP